MISAYLWTEWSWAVNFQFIAKSRQCFLERVNRVPRVFRIFPGTSRVRVHLPAIDRPINNCMPLVGVNSTYEWVELQNRRDPGDQPEFKFGWLPAYL